MGFVAGLGVPTGMGVPTYYVSGIEPSNDWDANTWVNIYFDSSGSMNDIIDPLTAVMVGAYCGSGSAAGGDCVRSTYANFPLAPTLRAELQDYYATGATEESGNTNASTNGATAYNAHIIYQSRAGELWLDWLYKRGTVNGTSTTSETWATFSAAQTVNNVVQVVVLNESKGTPSNPFYHRTQFGDDLISTHYATVVGAQSWSAGFAVDDGSLLILDGRNTNLFDASTRLYITAITNPDSSAGGFTPGVYVDTINPTAPWNIVLVHDGGGSSSLIECDDDAVITFQIRSYGWHVIGIDGFTTYLGASIKPLHSDTGSPDTGSPDNHPTYVTNINAYRSGLASGAGGFGGADTNGNLPSLTVIVIDSGLQSQYYSGYVNNQVGTGSTLRADAGNAAGTNRTASQRFIQEGVIEGLGDFANTRSDGNNYSLQGFGDDPLLGTGLLAWNAKSNLISSILLENENTNDSQVFWFNQLRNALLQNINF